MGRLLIARHGETELNGKVTMEYVRGWDSVPLNARGRREAMELAEMVQAEYRLSTVFTSDLPRAMETAEFVADRCGVGMAPDVNLRTWNLGYLTGKPVQDVLTDLQFYDANPDACPRDGETKNHFLNRYATELTEALNEIRRSKFDAVLLTHGRNISATPAILQGRTGYVPYQKLPATGALMEVKPDGKRWKLYVFPKHLRQVLR